jgi:3',5'-cyclic AMP phosphodiesterase CpdA
MGTSSSMQIRWRTNIASSTKVNYGTNVGSLNNSVIDETLTTEHIVNLINFESNTQYYYNIGSTTEVLQGTDINYFITAPTIGTEKKTRVWVTGDCGTGTATQVAVKNKFLDYVGSQYIDLWLILGDNAYSFGYDAEYQTKFFEPYQNDRIMKQTVLFPTPGNHDYGATGTARTDHIMPYYSNFSLPSNGEVGGVPSGHKEYYSYNYANIHFVSLDSYGLETANNYRIYDAASPQITWLKADLAANTQKWTVLYWHHPPYTMGSHNSDTESELKFIRQNVVPILDQYKVDLVLCGHSHNYERSRLMKGHTGLEPTFDVTLHNPTTSSGQYDGSTDSCPYIKTSDLPNTGILYVVAGSAGWATTTQAAYPHNAMYFSHTTNGGSLYLEVEGNRLDAKWIADDGVIRDKFTMMKDVNVKQTITQETNLNNITLSASWNGNYGWQNTNVTSRSLVVSPINNTQYIVKDNNQCLADTFLIQISNPNCQPSLSLTAPVSSNSFLKYEAGQTISGNNLINSGANVTYNATNQVILLPGFQAQNGVTFSASINGCSNANTRQVLIEKSPPKER